MTQREKILAAVVGGVVAISMIGVGIRIVVMKPLREMDKKISAAREKLEKAKGERRAFFAAEEQIRNLTSRTFSDNIDQASAKSAEMLTRQFFHAGLPESDFTRLPAGPRKLRGAQEIGWTVQGDGPLMQVINLIYLLQAEPHLNRVEGLVVTEGDKPGFVRVRFRYLTLVVDPAPADVKFTNLVQTLTLDSPERRILDGIVKRDILRPYVKMPPAPPASPGSSSTQADIVSQMPSAPEKLKVVSLSEWQGRPEIHVRNLVNGSVSVHRPGEELAGGRIVMVDYRALPLPGKAMLQSFARVILKQGNDFWAVERGSTLDEKYKLAPAQLPERLAAQVAAPTQQ